MSFQDMFIECSFKIYFILPLSESDVPQKSHTKSSRKGSVSSKELDSDVHHSREKKGS